MSVAVMQPWSRLIILMDMDAFFAAIEQRDCKQYRGQPVVITNGLQGSCIITCSYEAREYGIHTGMRLREAKKLCPDLIRCPARPRQYAQTSTAIMQSLAGISPDVEIFSVDEAFLDATYCQRLLGSPEEIAMLVKNTVYKVSGLTCSIGVSGDKSTAKYAAKLGKPDGLTIIPPWLAKQTLRDVPVTKLCGIAKGIGAFLRQRGVRYCGEMEKIPLAVMTQRYGQLGRRIWLMAQGRDPAAVSTVVPAPKTMGHSKVVPPNTRDREILLTYLQHMSEKVAARLRRNGLKASQLMVSLRTDSHRIKCKYTLAPITSDGAEIMQCCRNLLNSNWCGEGIFQVNVLALRLHPENQQMDLLGKTQQEASRARVNAAMDAINQKYGDLTLTPLRLLARSSMPDVIAPSWKPSGHRRTV